MHNVMLICLFFLCSCRPSPFQVKALTPAKPHTLEATPTNSKSDFSEQMGAALKKRYQQLKSPSFALINGYYRLPNAAPFGSATVVKSYSYYGTIETLRIEEKEQAYAIEPMLGDDALALNQGLNALLNLGVRIKEMPLTDALALAKAEGEAARKEKGFSFSEHLPPEVDYLISINKSSSERGPMLVGRVVAKDGRLLAFRILYHGNNHSDVSSLIVSLFEDTINRI